MRCRLILLAPILALMTSTAHAQQTVRSIPDNEPVSPFLRDPHADPYATGSGLDPDRRASFFGVPASGRVIVFVIDASGSMGERGKIERARIELRRSVSALRPGQKFLVIAYDESARPMPDGLPRRADAEGRQMLARWLRTVDAGGETNPLPALKHALSLRPDVVYLLSDGEFPPGTAAKVAALNADHTVPIHGVDLSSQGASSLRAISEASRGRYAHRP
jgi:Mg-chelatase subunit ChlD